jgi:hypothetical protein
MAGLPLDLSKYYQSPFGLLGQMGQGGSAPPFIDDGQNDVSNQEDLADEYEGQAGYYPPSGASYSATVAAGPRQKSAAELRSQQDYDQLRAAIGQAPKETAPKWWQRAAGAAAGFGAGWSNAAGRSRAPIDIGAMRENILHPGYQQKLQEWQSRVAPLQQIAGLDQSQVEQERRTRQTDIQEDWNKARAEAEHQRGVMWAARARAYDKGKLTGKIASTPDERADIAKRYNFDPDMTKYFIANGNLTGYGSTLESSGKAPHWTVDDYYMGVVPGETPEQKTKAADAYNAKHPGPDLEGRELSHEWRRQQLAEAANKAGEGVTKSKQGAEAKIHAQRRQEVAALMKATGTASEDDLWTLKDTAEQLRKINRRYAGRLQAVQDSYAGGIRKRGGTADDYTIDPDTLRAIPK